MSASLLARRIPVAIRPLVSSQPALARSAVAPLQQHQQRNYWPTRYDPFQEMENRINRMFRDFDRTFPSSFLRGSPVLGSRGTLLPLETYDKGKGLLKLEVDLPDFKPEEISVTVKDGQLEVSAKSETKGDMAEYRQVCYRYTLPKDTDVEKVRSLLKPDGRLLVEAPLPQAMLEAAAKPKEDQPIPIKKE